MDDKHIQGWNIIELFSAKIQELHHKCSVMIEIVAT
jgi:hypothetical protein